MEECLDLVCTILSEAKYRSGQSHAIFFERGVVVINRNARLDISKRDSISGVFSYLITRLSRLIIPATRLFRFSPISRFVTRISCHGKVQRARTTTTRAR